MAEAIFQLGQKALIINERDEVLLVGQILKGHTEVYYDFPGGRVDDGEQNDLEGALKRELREELQLEIAIHDLLTFSMSPNRTGQKHRIILFVYHCSINSGEPDTSKDIDVFEHKWVPINDLINTPGCRYSQETIDQIKQKLGLN